MHTAEQEVDEKNKHDMSAKNHHDGSDHGKVSSYLQSFRNSKSIDQLENEAICGDNSDIKSNNGCVDKLFGILRIHFFDVTYLIGNDKTIS
jgi:hypothetical protein